MKTESYDKELSLWIDKEKTTSELSNVVSRLILEHSTELVMFRNRMTHISISEVLNLHDYAAKFVKQNISVHQTLPLAKSILELGVKNAKIDLGKLAYEWNKENSSDDKLNDFVKGKLSAYLNKENNLSPKDVILYGFGRIGRLVARELFLQDNERGGPSTSL